MRRRLSLVLVVLAVLLVEKLLLQLFLELACGLLDGLLLLQSGGDSLLELRPLWRRLQLRNLAGLGLLLRCLFRGRRFLNLHLLLLLLDLGLLLGQQLGAANFFVGGSPQQCFLDFVVWCEFLIGELFFSAGGDTGVRFLDRLNNLLFYLILRS